MRRIIVSGGNGFVGKYVVAELLEQGYDCVVVDRRFEDKQNANVMQIQSNLAGFEDIRECSKKIVKADVFVHLAADISVPGDASTVGNNIEGMYVALEIAKEVGVEQFIFLSSIPVIGSVSHTPITEEHPVYPQTPYHWSKYLGEKMLEQYRDCFTSTILRIPSPIGVGMRKNTFLPVVITKMLKGEAVELYGSGQRIQNYIDVRDIASAIRNVVDNKIEGLFLISGADSVSNIELVTICKELLNSNSEVIIGKHPDPEEGIHWIISSKKACEAFEYYPRHSFRQSVGWIINSME